MRSLIVLGVALATLSVGSAYAQSINSDDLGVYNQENKQKNRSEKPNITIGMNLINSDGSSMGTYVLNESDTPQQYNAISKDYPQKGLDNEKYAKAMKTGNYAEAEEINTCRLDVDEKM